MCRTFFPFTDMMPERMHSCWQSGTNINRLSKSLRSSLFVSKHQADPVNSQRFVPAIKSVELVPVAAASTQRPDRRDPRLILSSVWVKSFVLGGLGPVGTDRWSRCLLCKVLSSQSLNTVSVSNSSLPSQFNITHTTVPLRLSLSLCVLCLSILQDKKIK